MLSIGVRELRQRASAILRAVEEGETVEVTNHGRPVARMVSVTTRGRLDQLVVEGRSTKAIGDLLRIPEASLRTGGPSLSQVLFAMRADER